MSAQPLHLALYGFVEKDAGGLASANYLLVKEMLRRGHVIDFYAVDPWIRPTDFFAFPNFTYRGVSLPYLDRGWKPIHHVPARAVRWAAQMCYSQVTTAGYNRAISKLMAKENARHPYDALLTLGLLSPFWVPKVPTISWTQGTPQGEYEGLVRQKQQLVKMCGRTLYWGLTSYYSWRQLVTRRELRFSHFVVGGSEWARQSWRRLGLPLERTFALPYPVDLQRFHPGDTAKPDSTNRVIEILHLGRLVPRKRLDLLLQAYQILRQVDSNVHLRIIGSFAYAHSYAELFQDSALMHGVTYASRIPYAEAVQALRNADLLVQPSENENFGTAVAEAQACGLPVVLGPTNGTQDYLDTREFLFERYDPQAVAEALHRAVQAVRLRPEELRQSARASAERQFSVENILDRLEHILHCASQLAPMRKTSSSM